MSTPPKVTVTKTIAVVLKYLLALTHCSDGCGCALYVKGTYNPCVSIYKDTVISSQ